MPEVVAIIPARSGSKGIKDKNIRLCNGKPLLVHSIDHARNSKCVSRVVVSTDSEYYADIARFHGASVPFIRPIEISGDFSTDLETFEHALRFFMEFEGYTPDICVHLRPTHPVREPQMIDNMVKILVENPDWDSIRSVSISPSTPYKMWLLSENGLLSPVASCETPEAYNAPRQILPKVYLQNACIDIVRSKTILEQHSMTGKQIGGYIQALDFDIDSESEFIRSELFLELKDKINRGNKLTVCIDIDGVIAHKTENNDYSIALPNKAIIDYINRIFDMGHQILLFTARGSFSGIEWEEITRKQLADWNVHYTELRFGKPAADIYVDDRFVEIDQLRAAF